MRLFVAIVYVILFMVIIAFTSAICLMSSKYRSVSDQCIDWLISGMFWIYWIALGVVIFF